MTDTTLTGVGGFTLRPPRISLLLVLAMELANSAIEAVIERYGSEFHELAGRAKDMGSAAVFVLMMNVLLCWGLVLAPRLFPAA